MTLTTTSDPTPDELVKIQTAVADRALVRYLATRRMWERDEAPHEGELYECVLRARAALISAVRVERDARRLEER